MSMFKNVDDYEIQAALHYKDHPMAVFLTNQLYLNVGTRTIVEVSIEEVMHFLFCYERP
jgi:hypothetical protein